MLCPIQSLTSDFDSMKKGIGFCYREEAIKVSKSQCSSPLNRPYSLSHLTPSIQREVTCTYRVKLSTEKQALISLTWRSSLSNHRLSIDIVEHPLACQDSRQSSIILRKVRGTKTLEHSNFRIDVFWNFCHAQYSSGPEPINGFYLVILLDSEPSLIIGDMDPEFDIKIHVLNTKASECTLASRSEHFSGTSVFATMARFCDTGTCHDVLIECCGEAKDPVLSVYIDRKSVARVRRLQWNFRGNQTIFLDGLLVDMMWDVHDWVFRMKTGSAVFLFRTRNGMDSRLWLEDKNAEGFCLRICACKNPD